MVTINDRDAARPGAAGDDAAFALIELLVVLLVIGLLAVIAIPSFLNQRDKGLDACAKNQVGLMRTTIESLYNDDNSYAGIDIAKLHQTEASVVATGACGSNTAAIVGGIDGATCNPDTGPTTRSYCISQTSGSGRIFVLTKDSAGINNRSCSPSGGGCTKGTW